MTAISRGFSINGHADWFDRHSTFGQIDRWTVHRETKTAPDDRRRFVCFGVCLLHYPDLAQSICILEGHFFKPIVSARRSAVAGAHIGLE